MGLGCWALLGERVLESMLLSRFLQHLFDLLRASGPKASLLAKKGVCLVLWVSSGFSLWAATAVECKPEP